MQRSTFDFQTLPGLLLPWYEREKRSLPWRDQPTPYRVWVSEIMLQQTRVEAVREYYLRFMQELPTVEDLAACPEEKLLKLWEGLGYYSRVRNLQKAARLIVLYYGGEFPCDVAALKELPGIGSYTAGAIASIAFGQPTAAVDGNVFRVASRLEENATPISDPNYRKYLEQELSKIYPDTKKGCSDFTQSLFEVGALICKPQNPDCAHCPLQSVCKANQSGRQTDYPVLPPKREKRREKIYVFLLQTPQGFCIRRREEGVLKGMNEFPSCVYADGDGQTPEQILRDWGVGDFEEIARKSYAHVFTHIRWDITCLWIKTDAAPFDAYALDEIEAAVSLPTAFKQCLGLLNGQER